MGKDLFQPLEGSEVEAAAADAIAWGFPRAISDVELDRADWFRMGESVVFWFEHYDELSTIWFTHLVVEPSARKRWGGRRWLRFMLDYAESHGATELGHAFCPGGEDAEGYWRRLGWQDCEYGLRFPLGAS